MKSLDDLIEEAKALESCGHYALALEVWKSAAALLPSVYTLCRLGKLYERLGMSEEAKCSFEAATNIDNSSALPLVGLGILANHERDFELSKFHLQRALVIERTASTFCLLGSAEYGMGNDREAESAYREALQLDPNNEEACYNLGVILRHVNGAEARALLERALVLNPSYSIAHRELGSLLAKEDAGPLAEYHLRRAIQINPRDAWAHILLGSFFEKKADLDAAIREFQTAAVIEPKRAYPMWALGDLYERTGDLVSSYSYYERAIAIEPDDIGSNIGLGRVWIKKGDVSMAKEYLGRALFLDPLSAIARKLLEDIT